MSKVLVLGAGMVARPLVQLLLQRGHELTLADLVLQKALLLLEGHPRGRAVALSTDDLPALERLAGEHDLLVSLLPFGLHPVVARVCVRLRRPMVTTSYVSPAMRELDQPAREAGVLLLNELGVDPGIDHMSAMQLVHRIQGDGGQVVSFRSYCGGLPAPEANDNPFGYKFSWSPLAVLQASSNSARYLKNGNIVQVPPGLVFADTHPLDFGPEVGVLEAYANRDSLGYQEQYGLQGVATLFRGTLRYPGWCETLRCLLELGLLDPAPLAGEPGLTWRKLLARKVGAGHGPGLRHHLTSALWLAPGSAVLPRLQWLGLLQDTPLPLEQGSPMQQLSSLMQQKMQYAPGQRDMIVLHHDFVARYPDRSDRLTTTLIDYGRPHGDSSMSRTVSLPAAIAADLVLRGKIDLCGVQIPTRPELYQPILKELESFDIKLVERVTPLS